MNIVLANASYRSHSTDEGDQLQSGLANAGWRLCGPYYDDFNGSVKDIVEAYDPKIVFVQDFRDWDKGSKGSFGRADLHFHDIDYLRRRPEIIKVCVVKDAGTATDYQREMCDRVGANIVVHYYHQDSILPLSPWLRLYKLVRTYHTVDSSFVRSIEWPAERGVAVVTGACSQKVYPLRHYLFHNAAALGIVAHKHPGYGNRKCWTPEYLEMLATYRVHLATCSAYKFSLRKLMESVAMGCIPVTNLPIYDCLPEIDGAMVRIDDRLPGEYNFKRMIRRLAMDWDERKARHWQERCLAYYDYRAAGKRLSSDIERAAAAVRAGEVR